MKNIELRPLERITAFERYWQLKMDEHNATRLSNIERMILKIFNDWLEHEVVIQ
jgi:hypothetical protein